MRSLHLSFLLLLSAVAFGCRATLEGGAAVDSRVSDTPASTTDVIGTPDGRARQPDGLATAAGADSGSGADAGALDSDVADARVSDSGAIDARAPDALPSAASDASVPLDGQPATVTRRLHIVIDPALLGTMSLAEAGNRLRHYVADVNKLFGTTRRRFSFDPTVDLESRSIPALYGMCYPLSAGFSFAAYLTNQSSFASCNLFDTNEFWVSIPGNPKIMTVAESQSPAYALTYQSTISVWAHELGHAHGVGWGEYYRLRYIVDTTGVAPDLSTGLGDGREYTASQIDDHYYWKTRKLVLHDPMYAPSATPGFTPLSQAIINRNCDERFLAQCPYGLHACLEPKGTDLQIDVEAVSPSGLALPNCAVTAYIQPRTLAAVPQPATRIFVGTTDQQGRVSIDLDGHLHMDSGPALIKVSCAGYAPAGDAVYLFDLQARSTIPLGGAVGDFHLSNPLRITLVP